LGSRLQGGEVIELRSDLGGGKTTFVKGLAKGAGSKDNVVSPTFTLNRIYQAGRLQIHHFDFYRLNDAGILADQLAESLNDANNVVVVEWADVVTDVLPDSWISVELIATVDNPDKRKIIFHYPPNLKGIFIELETAWQESRP